MVTCENNLYPFHISQNKCRTVSSTLWLQMGLPNLYTTLWERCLLLLQFNLASQSSHMTEGDDFPTWFHASDNKWLPDDLFIEHLAWSVCKKYAGNSGGHQPFTEHSFSFVCREVVKIQPLLSHTKWTPAIADCLATFHLQTRLDTSWQIFAACHRTPTRCKVFWETSSGMTLVHNGYWSNLSGLSVCSRLYTAILCTWTL